MHAGTFRVMELMVVNYVLILLKMGGTLTEIEKRWKILSLLL